MKERGERKREEKERGEGWLGGRTCVREEEGDGGREKEEVESETLYHRDDALLYIAYVMLIVSAPIPAARWPCSLWP